MKRKRFYNTILAFTLVLAVSAALWFTAPVSALNISFPSLPSSDPPGSTHSFTVNVTISDAELLPIQKVDVIIYKSDNPTNYKATLESLPLGDSAASTHPITEGPASGSATVAADAGVDWGYIHGYGYAAWKGTPYYFGYGYGYGYGFGPTSIIYTIEWTSPSNWLSGNYKIEAKITANSTTFTETSNDFIITSPPPPPPPGGGGGGLEAPPGITYVSNYVGTSGIFIMNITADSDDGKAALFIPKGTKGKTKLNEPLWQIEIFKMLSPPASPADAVFVGSVYEIGPEGATFEPPITLTITFDPADVPPTVDKADLVIAMWDGDAEQWVVVEGTTVDLEANTVSVPITRFTNYTILAYAPVAIFTTSTLTISPAEADIGELVTVSVLVSNTGGLSGSYTVVLKINDEVVESRSVTVAGDSSQMVTFTGIPTDVAGTYKVTIDDLSDTFTVKKAVITPPPAPDFTTSTLTVSPGEVKTGEPVTVSVLINNTGGAAGTYITTLKIDGTVVDTRNVTLTAGSSQTVTFTDIPTDIAGTYTVTIDGLSDTFTVKSVINWWFIGITIGVGVIVGVFISIVIRRRWA